MKRVIIITGPIGSGKTYTAKKLTEGLQTIIFDYSELKPNNPFRFSQIEKDDEAIIIEGVSDSLEPIAPFLYHDELTIDKQGKEPFQFKIPLVIITSQNDNLSKLNERPGFEFIECNYQANINPINQKIETALRRELPEHSFDIKIRPDKLWPINVIVQRLGTITGSDLFYIMKVTKKFKAYLILSQEPSGCTRIDIYRNQFA